MGCDPTMEGRKYVVDSDPRESADSGANPRDTLEDTIELRNDDKCVDLFDQYDESNQEVQAKCNEKHSGDYLNLETRNLASSDLDEFDGLIARTTKQRFNDVACLLIHGVQGYINLLDSLEVKSMNVSDVKMTGEIDA